MFYIGIDLGGTNIATAIVNEYGQIIRKDKVPTLKERPANEIVYDMAMLVKKLIEDEGIGLKEVHSIGIGSPGVSDCKNGVLLYSNNIKNFVNINLREDIQKYIDLPVYLDNDANCAALGESICGAGKEYRDCVVITLGTGVGGGVIIENKIMTGSFYGGAELGHHVIVVDGEECTCGRKGCWETYSSATALIRDAKIAAIKNPQSMLNSLVNINEMNAKTPFDAAQAGDEIAIEVIDRYMKYLSVGITNMINIFQPEVLVIGGGICAQKDHLINPLKVLVEKQVYGIEGLKTTIKVAELGNDAGIIGAAFLKN